MAASGAGTHLQDGSREGCGRPEGPRAIRERTAAARRRPARASGRAALACAATLVAALSSGCVLLPPQGTAAVHPGVLHPPPTAQLTTVPVEYGDVQKTIQVAGVIRPCRVAQLYFRNGGTIAVLHMREGQNVKAGQLLASFNTQGDLYQIAQQRLTIKADQVALRALAAQDAASPATSAADAERRAVALAQARIQLAEDQLRLEEYELQFHGDQVVAPWSGQITKVNNAVGDYVSGDQVIAELDDVHCGLLVANLNGDQASLVAPGDPAAVALTNASTNRVIYTTVESVQVPTPAQVAVAQQNAALGALKNPQVRLALPRHFRVTPDDIGVAFQAQITVASASNVLYLPSSLISSFNGLYFVNLDRNGVVTERPVKIGLQGDQDTVILAGLQSGDQVVQP